MSILNSGFSAIGRLFGLAVLLAVFLFGLVGVVYMSLQGSEIKVPEITGKDIHESEKELALLGLKIKKRADRVSAEKPDTVIEQLPKPGETVKTGQMILVVTSKGGGTGEAPPGVTTEEDDAEKIEEMISDKPKKPKANSNTNRKKADTARDVGGDNSNKSESNSTSKDGDSNKKESGSGTNSSEKPNKNTQTGPTPKPGGPSTKPAGGDTKPKTPARPGL